MPESRRQSLCWVGASRRPSRAKARLRVRWSWDVPSAPASLQQRLGSIGAGLLPVRWAEGLDRVPRGPAARRRPRSFWCWLDGEWRNWWDAVIAISSRGEDGGGDGDGDGAGVAECCWSSLGGGSHRAKLGLIIDPSVFPCLHPGIKHCALRLALSAHPN